MAPGNAAIFRNVQLRRRCLHALQALGDSALPTLIFDLDGTLADTLPDLANAVNYRLQSSGEKALHHIDVRHMIGNGVPKLVQRAFAARGIELEGTALEDETEAMMAHYRAHLCDESVLYEGVSETLEALQLSGWRMGVCTNKPQYECERLLEALGISGRFSACVGGDKLPGCRKPNPGHLISALVLSGGEESEGCVLVGDSAVDVATARAAGFPVVGCTYGYTREPMATLCPDATIDSFQELPGVLQRWDGRDGRDSSRSL